MAYIKINDILKKRGKKEAQLVPQAVEGARIKVLIGGCSHCAKLRDNVLEAAAQLGIPESDIEVITDLAKIMRFGIMSTPALIVEGRIVSIGKVLPVDKVAELIKNKSELS
jgi:hypothetical protein